MKPLTSLFRSAVRAAGAWGISAVAIWYPPRPARPMLRKEHSVETVAFIHLMLARDFPGPHDVNWAQGRWIATDLGNGSPMRLVRLARDGSLVFQQANSVIQLVVLAPGSVIPDRFDSRCAVALSAVSRRPVL